MYIVVIERKKIILKKKRKRTQITDIININNVVPVSLFLTLSSYQHLL